MGKIIICLGCGKERKLAAKGLCKPCYMRSYHRDYYQKHRAKILATNCQWMNGHREEYREYKNQYNREHQEKHSIYAKNWYRENWEETLERSRQWAKRNPKRYATNQRRWREENSERRNVIEARREARKKDLPSTLTEKERTDLFLIGEGTYPNEKLHLDHVIPISKGGGTTRANLHYIPAILNCSKKDKLPQEVYKQSRLWRKK